MAQKIKDVPMGTIKSVAALVCPSGLSQSLPNELPSSWYNYYKIHTILNLSLFLK